MRYHSLWLDHSSCAISLALEAEQLVATRRCELARCLRPPQKYSVTCSDLSHILRYCVWLASASALVWALLVGSVCRCQMILKKRTCDPALYTIFHPLRSTSIQWLGWKTDLVPLPYYPPWTPAEYVDDGMSSREGLRYRHRLSSLVHIHVNRQKRKYRWQQQGVQTLDSWREGLFFCAEFVEEMHV